MESWKLTFIITIIIGFFASFAFGPAVLIIPIIMIIILVIASARSKPKPQTYTTTQSEPVEYRDSVTRNNSTWQPKQGGLDFRNNQ
jgi:hypothetical protein